MFQIKIRMIPLKMHGLRSGGFET